MKLSDVNPIAWIIENRIKTSSGEPFDLKQHYFWYDIINDLSPHQVWLKAAQSGGTEVSILKAIYLCDRRKMNVIYTMPSDNDISSTIGPRLNKLIKINPTLSELIKDKDSVQMKIIGDKELHVRGTRSESAAISVPADVLIHDEEDRSDQSTLGTYRSRLQHSKYKWDWHFSNPSFQGHGVDKFWQKSDQKHWFIKCRGCALEQYLSWPDSIDPERREFVCKSCGSVFSADDRRRGRWVKKFKDREYSGYWISALMCPWLDANYILKEFEAPNQDKAHFFNFVLGLPYVGEGNVVTPDLILRNCTQDINKQDNVVIGCDSGLTKHFVLGNNQGLFHYGKTQTWETIEGFLRRFNRSVAIIDALPDLTEPRRLRERYPGRVFLNYYSKDRKAERFIRWGKKEEEGNIQSDRNKMIQMVIDEFSEGVIPLQGTSQDWSEYYDHWKTLYREEQQDALGNPWFVWNTSNGMDHWVHATVLWRIGMDRFGKSAGGFLNPQGLTVQMAPTIEPDGTIENPFSYASDFQLE